MDQSAKKLIAAQASLEFIQDGMVLGVGTGSTVNQLIDLLPGVKNRLDAVVSSSADTKARLEQNGFEVTMLNKVGDVDLYIDGADEATKHMHLIKGGGGALTREKVIAGAARKFVCIIDDSKLVGMLGTFPLPIEVIPMAQAYVARQLVSAEDASSCKGCKEGHAEDGFCKGCGVLTCVGGNDDSCSGGASALLSTVTCHLHAIATSRFTQRFTRPRGRPTGISRA